MTTKKNQNQIEETTTSQQQDTFKRNLRLNFHHFDCWLWWIFEEKRQSKSKSTIQQKRPLTNVISIKTNVVNLLPKHFKPLILNSIIGFIFLINLCSFAIKSINCGDLTDQVQLQISQAERFRSAHQSVRRKERFLAPLNQEPVVINSPMGSLMPRQILVPGSVGGAVGQGQEQIILPYETFARNFSTSSSSSREPTSPSSSPPPSYIIDNKRFVEAFPTRCLASTILENPSAVEPSFIIVRPNSEIRLNATIPTEFIRLAGFEAQKPTTIIIHGFTQSYPSTGWLRKVRALYEIHSLVPKHNLIIMDWGKASQGSYAQVAAMVSGMGSFLANFIMKLLDLGTDRMSIHIIGHSLGAHLAGFAGKRIRPRLGRITALDPAGPCFGKIFTNSAQDRLSPDDAYEVDVYHYDDDFLGLPGQHGQFDVYVNGGSSQPGCSDNVNSMFQALLTMIFRRNRVLSESHTRSTEVSTMRLSQTGCQQVAYECRNYLAFKMGECGFCDDSNSQCFLMGFNFQYADMDTIPLRTSFPGKKMYISTGSNELYCLNHYQVLVKLVLPLTTSSSGHQQKQPRQPTQSANKWRLKLELYGDLGKRVDLNNLNQIAPNIYSYLLLTENQPVRFKAAKFQIQSLETGHLIGLEVANIEVNFMSHVNSNVRRAMSSRLCPLNNLAHPLDGTASNVNSINVDSPQSDKAWLHFDECFSGPLLVAPIA